MRQIEHEISSGNVYADIGCDNPAEALMKADLAIEIASIAESRRLDKAAIAALLGVDQSAVTQLLRGQFDAFSIEMLRGFTRTLSQDAETGRHSHPMPAFVGMSRAAKQRGARGRLL